MTDQLKLADVLRFHCKKGRVFDETNDTVVVTRNLLLKAADEIDRLCAIPTPDARVGEALREIAAMDPNGVRADDLGRAARVATAALSPQPGAVEPERAADGNTYRYHATGLPVGGDRATSPALDPATVEACAKVVEYFAVGHMDNALIGTANDIAAAIRALAKEPDQSVTRSGGIDDA